MTIDSGTRGACGALGIKGVRIGVFTDLDNRTGCTVVLPPAGTVGGVAVRGGAPGTRESAILGPQSAIQACHGVVLCGSSLFGLRAADGVVDWCEARGIGLEMPAGRFPIVGAAVVLDLRKPGTRRITSADGFAACEAASSCTPASGSVGVGTGCGVGKEAGMTWGSKGGQGVASEKRGELVVSAIVAVNALGSVYGEDGRILAGCRAPDGHPRYPEASWADLNSSSAEVGSVANTVIGCIVTNARLAKHEVCRVADLAHTGIARCVSPAHTDLDGDALFALATQAVDATVDQVADLAARAVQRAIRDGVRQAEGTDDLPTDPRARV